MIIRRREQRTIGSTLWATRGVVGGKEIAYFTSLKRFSLLLYPLKNATMGQ